MTEINSKEQYLEYRDAIEIAFKKRRATYRWIAEYVCNNLPHLVEKVGWNKEIIKDNPTNQSLGVDICYWVESTLNVKYLTDGYFEFLKEEDEY
jgi:hypothetical protein